MKTIKCPCCNNIIEIPTYYSMHRIEMLNKYKENMKDPEFVKRKRAIALKAYHKNKKLKRKKDVL